MPKQDFTSIAERDPNAITGEVTRKREVVGPLEDETWYQARGGKDVLGAGAKSIQSSLINDFSIPEYPEADLWIEELLLPSMGMFLVRGD